MNNLKEYYVRTEEADPREYTVRACNDQQIEDFITSIGAEDIATYYELYGD